MSQPKLNLISMNVRGLRNAKKRRSLFYLFKKGNYDVIGLQETHLTRADKDIILREWGSNFYIAEGSTNSKGLLTLYGKSIKMEDTSLILDNNRCLISLITSGDVKLLVANVYGTCNNSEKHQFLLSLKSNIKENMVLFKTNDVVVFGDFNIVKNNDYDILSGNPHHVDTVSQFNSVINELLLIDIWREHNQNVKDFTWSCKSPFIARRLDYIFVSPDLFPFCYSPSIKTIGFSDHRAVSVTLDFSSFKRGPGTFKFNAKLLHNQDYVKEVKNEITKITCMDLDPHFKWEYIKIKIKNLAMSYGKALASKTRNDKNILLMQLEEAETSLTKDPDDVKTIEKYSHIKQQLEIILTAETEGARIRAGQKWAEEGEKCTKYFLNLEKQRSNNNTLFKLKKDNSNEIITSCDEILSEIATHFSNLYSYPKELDSKKYIDEATSVFLDPANRIQVSDIDNITLSAPLSENELLNALKMSKNGSSPGIDGLSSDVYKFFWADLKVPLMNCIRFSLETGRLCTTQNQGMICLLHKGKGTDRDHISNWRPIALTNFDYKLLAKVLAIRLVGVLDHIIDADQHAFMKDRCVANMLREIDDIVEFGKSEMSGNIILSIDYAKAFDTLSKEAIMSAMKYYGMGNYFIRWIDILLKERESCIRNGGYLSNFFQMDRGVRQGCPISPLLFILTVELFSRNIRNDNTIKGINIKGSARPVKIKTYADDTTLFLRDMIDFREVLSRIRLFSFFTGLFMNKSKSFAMFISDASQKGTINHGIKFVNRIKILGIIFSNEQKVNDIKENIDPKIDQLKRLCSLWSKRNLSILGKITILKSFGLSLFTYTMQSIGICEEKLIEINKICFRFIWKRNCDDKKAYERVKRKTMCNDIDQGGLKMFNIIDIQNSFFLYWAERLLRDGFENWKAIPQVIFKRVGGIYAFSSNVPYKEFKGKHLIKNVFWEKVLSTWLDQKYNFNNKSNYLHLQSPLFNNELIKYKNETLFSQHCCQICICTVGDVMERGEFMSFPRFQQKFGFRSDALLSYNIIYNALLRHIQTLITLTSPELPLNSLSFGNHQVGNISRKLYLQLIQKIEIPYAETFWIRRFESGFDKRLWVLPFKCTNETRLRVLQWKILHNIYPTSIHLKKMKLKDSDLCKNCNILDTIEHFFFDCDYIKNIWKEIETLITKHTNQILSLNSKSVLLGWLPGNNLIKTHVYKINLFILIGKLVISKCKYGKVNNPLILLENEITFRKML